MVNPPLLSVGKKDRLFICGMNKVSWIKHQILQSFGCANLVLGCENLVCFCLFLGFQKVFVDVETVNLPLLSMGKTDVLFVCGMNRILLIQHQMFDHFGVPFWFCGVKIWCIFVNSLASRWCLLMLKGSIHPFCQWGRRMGWLFLE